MAGEIIGLAIIIWVCASAGTAVHAAENRKTPLWGVLVAFTGILGLLIYAISLASD